MKEKLLCQGSNGEVRLMTVPPYIALSPQQLLVPEELLPSTR
jgi:hypothetical protein